MMSGLEVRTDRSGKTAVVHAMGEVDMSTAPRLLDAVLAACATAVEPKPVVVDLTAVDFFGSSGITVLVQAQERCQAQRTPLRVVAASRAVLLTLHLCGLDTVLDIRSSLANATRVQVA
jgi:anti-sigma B factor antagonist